MSPDSKNTRTVQAKLTIQKCKRFLVEWIYGSRPTGKGQVKVFPRFVHQEMTLISFKLELIMSARNSISRAFLLLVVAWNDCEKKPREFIFGHSTVRPKDKIRDKN